MVDLTPTKWIMKLYLYGLSRPIRSQSLSNWKKKSIPHTQVYAVYKKTHFKYNNMDGLKENNREKIF